MELSCEPMDKNRIEGATEQGERATNREALAIKAKRRTSGGCAAKECVLTWGDLALCVQESATVRDSRPLLNRALPVAYFDRLGVPRLS